MRFGDIFRLRYNRSMIRDKDWLKYRLETIWVKHFPDVKLKNNVFVKFGRKSKTRLGSIRLYRAKENPSTTITITGYFTDPAIPEYVVDAVLAHELTHYAQGFCSPHQQAYRHPHRGGVVKNELVGRGLADLLKAEKKWIKLNWREYIKQQYLKGK